MARRARGKGPMVYLIGLGIPEIKSVSQQAVDSLRACKTLYVNDPSVKFFTEICPDVRPIGAFGAHWGKSQMDSFARKIFSVARRAGPVGLAVYGHPMLYEPLGHFLLQACSRYGVSCEIVGGLSTFDAVLSTLKLSLYGGVGVQMGDPSYFLNSKPQRNGYVFVLQACMDLNLFRQVVRHCLVFYPRSHKIALVQSDNWSPERVSWVSLSQLSRKAELSGLLYATLIIPPCAAAVSSR